MSWTNGQSARTNQSPFIDPVNEERSIPPASTGYTQQGHYKKGYRSHVPSQPAKEVAATFTQEGLATFASIFSSSVEAAMMKALPEVVDRVFAQKVEPLFEQLANQLRGEIEAYLATSRESIERPEENVQESAAMSVEHGLHIGNPNSSARLSAQGELESDGDGNRIQRELEAVLAFLKDAGRAVRTKELCAMVPSVYWGKNASAKLTKLMRVSKGQIERIDKGLYRCCEVQ